MDVVVSRSCSVQGSSSAVAEVLPRRKLVLFHMMMWAWIALPISAGAILLYSKFPIARCQPSL